MCKVITSSVGEAASFPPRRSPLVLVLIIVIAAPQFSAPLFLLSTFYFLISQSSVLRPPSSVLCLPSSVLCLPPLFSTF
jgi:hypothetical protein